MPRRRATPPEGMPSARHGSLVVDEGEEELHVPDKQSMAASIATLLITLPALVGS